MIETMLLEAVELAREGRYVEARWLLQEVLRADRGNETAWLLMADCAETREESILALESCLRHVPNAARARVGLDILRTEKGAYRRGGLLTDRLNRAVKNVKSRPRKPLMNGKLAQKLDIDSLEKLRQEVPASWVPIPEEDDLQEAVSSTEAARAGANNRPAVNEPAYPVFDDNTSAPDDDILDEEFPDLYRTPGEETGTVFWLSQPQAEETAPAEPVDAFLVSPDLFTPEEISELEQALGDVPVARRRVSLFNDPAEAWKNLSETEQPLTRRVQRHPVQPDRYPLKRVLLYAMLALGIVVVVAAFLLVTAFILSGL